MSRNDLPMESRFKYGSFDDISEDEANDIDTVLSGGRPDMRVRSRSVSQSPDASEVDEDFFSSARDSTKKYGG